MNRFLALSIAALLAACASVQPKPPAQPLIDTASAPVAVSCVRSDYKARPEVPTRAQIAAADGPTQFDLLGRYFALTEPWAAEAAGVIGSCQEASAPNP